jgi:DNA-directed RNA polymerase I, II, and III subunit RPABC5
MIIPVKCFTCGNVLANKYMYYVREVRKIKIKEGADQEQVVYLTKANVTKTPEGRVLDKMGLTEICCRRHMLTHVDIE